VDNDAYIAFVLRILRTLRRRATYDAELLSDLIDLQREIQDTIDDVVRAGLHPVDGGAPLTYQQLADLVGKSKQAVHQRYATSAAQRQSDVNPA
jgi:hypothetical protein